MSSLTSRTAPYAGALAFAIFLAAALLPTELRSNVLNSSDTFLHLRLGQEILASGSLPRADMLSFTAAGRPYAAHEWGFEVLIASIFRLFGYAGLYLAAALLGAVAAALVVTRLRARACGAIASLIALALAWRLIRYSFVLRPQCVTYAAFSAGLLWLDSEAWRRAGLRQAAAVLACIAAWTWIHPASIFFIGVLAVDVGVASFSSSSPERKRALLVVVAAALGFVANPYGLAVPRNLMTLAQNHALVSEIYEHMPLDTGRSVVGGLVLIEVAALGLYVLASLSLESLRKPRAGEVAAILALFAATLYGHRWTSLFALAATPLFATAVGSALELGLRPLIGPRFPTAGTPISATSRPWPRGPIFLYVASLAIACFASYAAPASEPGTGATKDHPIEAARYVRMHPELFKGRMFNPYGYGGYLSFDIPDHKVFVDGRTEFYPVDVILDSLAIRDDEKDAMKVVEKWKIDWAICKNNSGCIRVFDAAGWHRAHEDDVATIFVRPS